MKKGMIAVLMVLAGLSSALSQGGEGKGTIGKGAIGLACIDQGGKAHLWNEQGARDQFGRTPYEACVEDLVRNWEIQNATSAISDSEGFVGARASDADEDLNQLIQGYETYRREMEGAKWRSNVWRQLPRR